MAAFKKHQEAFFALLRAGLWERETRLLPLGNINYEEILRLSEEQSVVGLIAAGVEMVVDVKPPKEVVLQLVGQTLQLEQQNTAMNAFISNLIIGMRNEGIYALLVKGQGVAQCYERPLWRACGDVDLFLDYENYEKAKKYLVPNASHVDPEDNNKLHLGMTIAKWKVELHGTMHTVISHKINRMLDDVQKAVFVRGRVREWNNNGVDIFLPNPDNDVIIVFSHFINHFYGEGVGLRQISDWCRLLWKYYSVIDIYRLEKRLREMNLITEWRVFAVFAVNYLGMPENAMPLYISTTSLKKKSERICRLIIEAGNFGHNKDNSYRNKSSRFMSNIITFWRRLKEFVSISTVFPVNAPIFFITYVFGRVKALASNGYTNNR